MVPALAGWLAPAASRCVFRSSGGRSPAGGFRRGGVVGPRGDGGSAGRGGLHHFVVVDVSGLVDVGDDSVGERVHQVLRQDLEAVLASELADGPGEAPVLVLAVVGELLDGLDDDDVHHADEVVADGGGHGGSVDDPAVVVDVPALEGGDGEVAREIPVPAQQGPDLVGHDPVVRQVGERLVQHVAGGCALDPALASADGPFDLVVDDVPEQDLVDLGDRVPHDAGDVVGVFGELGGQLPVQVLEVLEGEVLGLGWQDLDVGDVDAHPAEGALLDATFGADDDGRAEVGEPEHVGGLAGALVAHPQAVDVFVLLVEAGGGGQDARLGFGLAALLDGGCRLRRFGGLGVVFDGVLLGFGLDGCGCSRHPDLLGSVGSGMAGGPGTLPRVPGSRQRVSRGTRS